MLHVNPKMLARLSELEADLLQRRTRAAKAGAVRSRASTSPSLSFARSATRPNAESSDQLSTSTSPHAVVRRSPNNVRFHRICTGPVGRRSRGRHHLPRQPPSQRHLLYIPRDRDRRRPPLTRDLVHGRQRRPNRNKGNEYFVGCIRIVTKMLDRILQSRSRDG